MKIMVTGGAGFIGSALVRLLVSKTAHEIVVLDKLTYAAPPGALDTVMRTGRVVLERVDICDIPQVRRVFREFRPGGVIHLAAESHVDRSIEDPLAFATTNVVGTCALLREAFEFWSTLEGAPRSAFRFLHVSTDEVFGSLGPVGEFTESSPYDPSSPYSASKAAADHFVRAWGRTYGLPVVISNCSNNYGAFQFPEKLIPLTITKAIQGARLPVYGRGENVRDWLFVDDHASALVDIFVRGKAGESYNVGGSAQRTNLAVVRAICGLLDRLAPTSSGRPHAELIEFVVDRPGHDLRYAMDASKLRAELGWFPRETFESGLRKTVDWYLDNPDWARTCQRQYSGERLGLGTASR